MPKKKPEYDFEDGNIKVFRSPLTHILVSMKDIEELGWKKAIILGAFHFYGGVMKAETMHQYITCISKEEIQDLEKELTELKLIKRKK